MPCCDMDMVESVVISLEYCECTNGNAVVSVTLLT